MLPDACAGSAVLTIAGPFGLVDFYGGSAVIAENLESINGRLFYL